MTKWEIVHGSLKNYKDFKCTCEFEREKLNHSQTGTLKQFFELDLLVMHFTLRTDIDSHSPFYSQSGWRHFYRTTARY